MPERGFNTEYWNDPFVQELSCNAQYLYIYLWNNSHTNQAGLYQITLNTISFETKIPKDIIPELLLSLEPKVKWYQQDDLVWVKSFLKRPAKSPKFLIAAAARLNDLNNHIAVQELLDYNMKKYRISIPYQYSIDSISILPKAKANANTKTKAKRGIVKGEKPETEKIKEFETFGELKNVKLTAEEKEKLVKRFGAQGATDWIEHLSLAKASKGYKSESDYATILSWERRDKRNGGAIGVVKKNSGQRQCSTAAEARTALRGGGRNDGP